MSSTEVRAGRVGRPHGLDGSFYVDQPSEALEVGTSVRAGTLATLVERRAGTAARPLLRLRGVDTRERAEALRGEGLYLRQSEADLGEGEYFAADLVGLKIDHVGAVRRVINGPSCDLLEVGDGGVLVPFVRDAIVRIDRTAGRIEVDRAFLGLE